jgi:LysM repeat protein
MTQRCLKPIYCSLLFLVLALLTACDPQQGGRVEEQKDPFFLKGRNLVTSKDYRGAIEQFEKALEVNPRSASAHFELAWLYEEHVKDFAAAIHHYQWHLRLRPNSEYVERARERIKACKMDLAKTELSGPVTQSMQRDLDRLLMENVNLRKQVETLQQQLASRPVYNPNPSGSPSVIQPNPTTPMVIASNRAAQQQSQGGPAAGNSTRRSPQLEQRREERPTAARPRTHVVQQGETFASIARKYGLKVNVLTAANPQLDPRKLKPGQSLNIPIPKSW